MAVSAKDRKRQQRAREKMLTENVNKAVLKAIESMPPEYADDCKMWISPPGLKDKRPRINWDIGAKTNALMETHAETYGVTLEAVLRQIGLQFVIERPRLYWAMKSAKINVSDS